MKSSFALIPFTNAQVSPISITGTIERQYNQLKLEYLLFGQSQIIIPATVNHPSRQDNLWKHTCCELFLGLQDSTEYWEFNLSPTGDWNVYHFLDYRQQQQEVIGFNSLPFQVLDQDDTWQLKLEVDLQPIVTPEQSLNVGITAVIEAQDNQLTYWGLTHTAAEADFHRRDSYLLKL